MSGLPTKALSIMQPWAALIVHGVKDIENRSWSTRFRGPVLIHAGKSYDDAAQDAVDADMHPVTGDDLEMPDGISFPTGGIVGVAEIVDCVSGSRSPWFVGEYGFLIRNAQPLTFRPCKGALGFFTPDYSQQYVVPKRTARKSSPQIDLFRGEL